MKQPAREFPLQFNFALQGKIVKLVYTNDPYTGLKPGATGTIAYTFKNLDKTCISVVWHNSNSTLMLIEGVDRYEILSV